MIESKFIDHILGLRPASIHDCSLIFKWRNLPEIVALSSSQKSIGWQEHSTWFQSALASEKKSINVITLDDIPIGILRYELINAISAEISIYIISGYTGRGFGVFIINESCKNFFVSHQGLREVVAFIQADNCRSLKAFAKAGFQEDRQGSIKPKHIRMVKTR